MKKNVLLRSIIFGSISIGLLSGIYTFEKINASNNIPSIHPYGESNLQINYVSCSDSSIPSSSYDDSKQYDYSTLSFVTKSGSFLSNVSTSENSLAVSDDLNNPLPYGSFEVTIKGTTDSTDDGIVFALEDSGHSSYWEGEGISYYFFFLGHDGYISLGKSENNTWASLYESYVGNFSITTSYTLKVVIRDKLVILYLNGIKQTHLIFNDYKLKGTKFGIRAGGNNVSFTNVHASSQYEYGL